MKYTIDVMVDDTCVGHVVIDCDDNVEPIHLAASAHAALSFRVGSEYFTKSDIAEWWA